MGCQWVVGYRCRRCRNIQRDSHARGRKWTQSKVIHVHVSHVMWQKQAKLNDKIKFNVFVMCNDWSTARSEHQRASICCNKKIPSLFVLFGFNRTFLVAIKPHLSAQKSNYISVHRLLKQLRNLKYVVTLANLSLSKPTKNLKIYVCVY